MRRGLFNAIYILSRDSNGDVISRFLALQMWGNAGLHENLHIPEPNEFIPTNFDLAPRDPEVPLPNFR